MALPENIFRINSGLFVRKIIRFLRTLMHGLHSASLLVQRILFEKCICRKKAHRFFSKHMRFRS